MENRKKKIAAGVGLLLFVLITAALCLLVGRPMIDFVSQPEKFRDWVDSHGIVSRLAFIGMVVFQAIVAVIPGEPLEIGAGYAFGAVEGTFLCVVGTTVGGIIVFALARTLGMRIVSLFFSEEKIRSVSFLQNTRRLNTVAFLVFLLPGTPKDLLSYCAGLTQIRWPFWLLLTSLARLPSIVTSTVGGNALGVQRYAFAVGVFAVTLVISGIGLYLYNRIAKKHDAS